MFMLSQNGFFSPRGRIVFLQQLPGTIYFLFVIFTYTSNSPIKYELYIGVQNLDLTGIK